MIYNTNIFRFMLYTSNNLLYLLSVIYNQFIYQMLIK